MSSESDRATPAPARPTPIRVAICWTSISGYMAACWAALSARPEVEIHVVAVNPANEAQTAFDAALMGSTPHTFVSQADLDTNNGVVAGVVRNFKPDVLVIPGWANAAYNALPFAEGLSNTPVAMTMDTPFLNTVRQRYGGWWHRRLFGRLARIIVPGERGAVLAKVLGFGGEKIVRGVYGVDFGSRGPTYEARRRLAGGWPKQFVYMGRYAPEKALDVLVDGYKGYRARVSDPWPLVCMGKGEMAHLLAGVPGITDLGFVQPGDQPKVLAESALFVLASTYDPWPLVIVESCAAGLPIVCTEACGSAAELVRPFFNGRVIPTGDASAMAEAMAWMHGQHGMLPEMGRRSRDLASAYTAEMWAERWVHMTQSLAQPQRR